MPRPGVSRVLTISILSTAAVSDSGGGQHTTPLGCRCKNHNENYAKSEATPKLRRVTEEISQVDPNRFSARCRICNAFAHAAWAAPLPPGSQCWAVEAARHLRNLGLSNLPPLETHTEDPTYINIEIRGNGVCTNAQSLFGSTCEISSVTSYELFRTVPTTYTKLSIPRNDQ